MSQAWFRSWAAAAALLVSGGALAQAPPPRSATATPDARPPVPDAAGRSAEAVALHDEAHALYEAGEYRKAIEKLERALELDPEGAELAYNIGLIYEKLGDVEGAERYYRMSLDLEQEPGMRAKLEGILKRIEGAKQEVVAPPAPGPSPSPVAPPASSAPSPPPAPDAARRDAPWLVAGGVATLGLAMGTTFAVAALVRDPGSDARTGDGSSIADLQDDADAAHGYAVVADISLLVGTIAAGLAIYFFMGRDDPATPATTARHSPRLRFDGARVRF